MLVHTAWTCRSLGALGWAVVRGLASPAGLGDSAASDMRRLGLQTPSVMALLAACDDCSCKRAW